MNIFMKNWVAVSSCGFMESKFLIYQECYILGYMLPKFSIIIIFFVILFSVLKDTTWLKENLILLIEGL